MLNGSNFTNKLFIRKETINSPFACIEIHSKKIPEKTNQLLRPLSHCLWPKLGGRGVVTPAFQKIGILFNIEKAVGQNVL